ncbi:hypothetical protein WJX72_009821 [[Myrmecia] bisecta]|uniref:Endoplasmic reticulum transmembrane protein n=1 Tax=[Myrmecia] bisecta TaxID=41462 RepID=A0AAW1QFY7_9CHLO
MASYRRRLIKFAEMVGFALPLGIFGGFELVLAVILLLPHPFSLPGVYLARATRSEVGRTVLSTVSAFLLLLLLSPVYESLQLHRSEPVAGEGFAHVAERRGSEAETNLSALLIGGTLVSMYVLRGFGLALGDVADLKLQLAGLDDGRHSRGTGAASDPTLTANPDGSLLNKAAAVGSAVVSQLVPEKKEE